ncbi:MAG: NAD-dependent epimerase/dehydratase family protein [Chloroflexi bacterium]|nr:MAG: NAD-dependent epimerase/dehydratase family protein [Chloroflexota bacterium]
MGIRRCQGRTSMTGSRFIVVGGAGFIGSHFADRLLADAAVARVTIYDNFSSGREWHLSGHLADPRLSVVRAGVEDLGALTRAMDGHDTVIHLASNPDIAKAIAEPAIDFDQGTLLTHHVVEAALGEVEADEDRGPLLPISTYGASKLAGEALICSYCHLFELRACAFRFGNVVGPRQTHGVGYDFIRRLLRTPDRLSILGDGTQSKSYIHVSDVVGAVLLAADRTEEPFRVYNVATGDHITVREIAELAVECVGLRSGCTELAFGGGDRGWKGDVPVVRLDTSRIRALGWTHTMSSREAMRRSMLAILDEATTRAAR